MSQKNFWEKQKPTGRLNHGIHGPKPSSSTGPTSDAGKYTSSRNALKHGGCSTATLILKDESMDDFLALEKTWFIGYNTNPDRPLNDHEAELIRTAARADWFSQRSERNYCEVEAKLMEINPLEWTDEHHKTLARFQRYRTTNANLVAKHRKAIEDYRKNRAQELAREQAFKIKEEKNKPPLNWKEEIESMRQQAVELGYMTPDGKPTGKHW